MQMLAYYYVLIFFIYSVAGWVMETTFKSIQQKRWANRGFLLGPIIPIYGVGMVLLTLILQQYADDPLVVIILSVVICGVLEYLTSWIMEKLFRARWWDYSNFKFNINGRVCLGNLVLFGLGGWLAISFANPFLFSIFEEMPNLAVTIITISLLIAFLVDILMSFKIIMSLRRETKKFDLTDNTEEITWRVRKMLMEKSAIYRRLAKAFPGLKVQPRRRKKGTKKSKDKTTLIG